MFQVRPPTHLVVSLRTEGVAVDDVWPYALAIFVSGGILTAVGLTILSNDAFVLAGMVLTSVGIVSMWLPGRGALRRSVALVIVTFLAGNLCTAIALTLSASNTLLLVGMMLSASGIGGMWIIGQHGATAKVICGTFIAGTTLQAIGLTVWPSSILIGFGMVAVSSGVFGMWLHAHPFRVVRDFQRDDATSRAIDTKPPELPAGS